MKIYARERRVISLVVQATNASNVCFFIKGGYMKNQYLFIFLILVIFHGDMEATAKEDQVPSVTVSSESSPFGIGITELTHAEQDLSEINNIGVRWIRAMGRAGMAWDFVEESKGVYNWSTRDELANLWQKQKLHVLWTIEGFNKWDQGVDRPNHKVPRDMDSYVKFISKAAERYDGDGIDDAPGSPIVNYWQVGNEINGRLWRDEPQKYVEYLRRTYLAIKSANPNAKILLAGATSPQGFDSYYTEVLNLLSKYGEKYFDIIDIHWYGTAAEFRTYENKIGEKTLVSSPEVIQKILTKLKIYGYRDIPVWFTEIGTHNNKAAGNFPNQTEKEQAVSLIKRYVYQVSHGIKKLFWYSMTEVPFDPENIFAYVGLINNPEVGIRGQHSGLSHKKLAYYTYKLMISKLEGADWNRIERVKDENGLHIYRFLKKDTEVHVWVAWCDNNQLQQVVVKNIDSDKVKITLSTPAYESGNQVPDFKSAFKVETKAVVNHELRIELGPEPVFIEICGSDCRASTPPPSSVSPVKSDNGENFSMPYPRNEKSEAPGKSRITHQNNSARPFPRGGQDFSVNSKYVEQVREEVARDKTTETTLQERYKVLMLWGRQVRMEGTNIDNVFPQEAARRLGRLVNNHSNTAEACNQIDVIYRQLGELVGDK